MKDLIETIGKDLKIIKYNDESDESYESRLIYSALAIWCLTLGKKITEDNEGISKKAITRQISSILEKYIEIIPKIKDFFYKTDSKDNKFDINEKRNDCAIFIRKIYEETGYFLNSETGFDILNTGGEMIPLSEDMFIYLGIPKEPFAMNGLGVTTFENRSNNIEIKAEDFLIRDDLTPEKFLQVNYYEDNFNSRNIELDDLEFFNPRSKYNNYKAWNKNFIEPLDMTIARNIKSGRYYKVLTKTNGGKIFLSPVENYFNEDQMSGLEYNRLYLALKKYYQNPAIAEILRIDYEYSELKLSDEIPNREYYYLLLNGWPKNFYKNKYEFIIRNYSKNSCVKVLKNIGFEII